MAGKRKFFSSERASYSDFEPASEWKREEHVDTWIIKLPDFKKEQLRVQVNKGRIMTVTGDNSTSAPGTKRRFAKETEIPEDCEINGIRAKFVNGELHITMPKKVAKPEKPPQQQEAADQKPKAQASDASCSYVDREKAKKQVYEFERKSKANKNVILCFGLAAVTMVAIGAFVATRFGSDYVCSSFYMDD